MEVPARMMEVADSEEMAAVPTRAAAPAAEEEEEDCTATEVPDRTLEEVVVAAEHWGMEETLPQLPAAEAVGVGEA
jgi:hypothetical protein